MWILDEDKEKVNSRTHSLAKLRSLFIPKMYFQKKTCYYTRKIFCVTPFNYVMASYNNCLFSMGTLHVWTNITRIYRYKVRIDRIAKFRLTITVKANCIFDDGGFEISHDLFKWIPHYDGQDSSSRRFPVPQAIWWWAWILVCITFPSPSQLCMMCTGITKALNLMNDSLQRFFPF